MSGSGKTNAVFKMIHNFIIRDKPFVIFDYKANIRDIVQMQEAKDVLIFTPGIDVSPFYFNPFRPPSGISDKHKEAYLRDVIHLIVDTLLINQELLSYKGALLLINRAMEIVKESGQAITPERLFHSLYGLKLRSRESDWRPTALFCIERISGGPPGHVYNARKSVDLNSLIRRKVIFELNLFGDEMDKALFIKLLLNYVRHIRMAEKVREQLKTVWIIEEAHNLFSQVHDRDFGKETLIDKMTREAREFGDAFVFVDQVPSKLPKVITANCATKISFTLSHWDDVKCMADSMLLDKNNIDYLGRLKDR